MKKKLNFFSTIKFLWGYITRYKKNFIMFYLGCFFDMLLSFTMPILFGAMIDEIVYYQNIKTFAGIGGLYMIMLLFSCALYFFTYSQHHYLMNRYIFDIKTDIFKKIHKCTASFMSNISTGEIITILQAYSGECMNFIIRNVFHTSNHIIMVLCVTAFIFVIDFYIGVLVAMFIPILIALNIIFGRKARTYGEKQRDEYGTYISWLYEILSGVKNLRMLGAKKKVNFDFLRKHKNLFDINIKTGLLMLNAENIIALSNLLLQLSIYTLIGYKAISGEIKISVVIIIISFFEIINAKIKILSESYLNAQDRISYIQRIYDFMHSPTEDEWLGSKELKITDGNIAINNLSFSYDNSPQVLSALNLSIRAGERIAVTGESGCGKTTLAYMLTGFYQPSEGYIEIDGQKLSDCTLNSIRRNIGIIQQDVLIFDGTIKDNIILGNTRATNEEVIAACRYAELAEYIDTLPNGINTAIGRGGIELSGGQKQRVAIARIFLKNPKIIIFDEATSSLDKETENQIVNTWETVFENRTCIFITHRRDLINYCNRSVVIEAGKIKQGVEKNAQIV